jgi:hypothetical protein
MPFLLVYQKFLPIGLWDFVDSLANVMRTAFRYLSVLLAGASVIPNVVQGMTGTYLLGLGEFLPGFKELFDVQR